MRRVIHGRSFAPGVMVFNPLVVIASCLGLLQAGIARVALLPTRTTPVGWKFEFERQGPGVS